MLCSRSLLVIALEMALRLISPLRRNRSVRFDQFEVAEAARPAWRCLRAEALLEYRPGGLDSFAAPVALVDVALDMHLASPSAAGCTETAHSRCMPDSSKCKTALTSGSVATQLSVVLCGRLRWLQPMCLDAHWLLRWLPTYR
jgi:hypothetical protein